MASKQETGLALGFAILTTAGAGYLSARGLFVSDDAAEAAGLNGFGALLLLPLDGLLVLTLLAYIAALAVPHTRLALFQTAVLGLFGVGMFGFGIFMIGAGLAAFASFLALLFAFPFGTIAYFAMYSCGAGDLTNLPAITQGFTQGGCFAGVQLSALAGLLLRALALAALLLASMDFAKVKGLIALFAWLSGFAVAVTALFWFLGDLRFVMFPADAILTVLLGVAVMIYGIVVFVKSLFAFALAIAGQAV